MLLNPKSPLIPRKITLPQLLVSVRNAVETMLVQEFEIGILDIKEPNRGGLGASDPATLTAVVNVLSSKQSKLPRSFSAGELTDWIKLSTRQKKAPPLRGGEVPNLKNAMLKHYGSVLLSEFQYVKVGLAGLTKNEQPSIDGKSGSKNHWQQAWCDLFETLPSGLRSVAVVYLDYERCRAPHPDEIINLAAETNHCDVVLFDTCHKSGNLFSHVSISEINAHVEKARTAGLKTVIAGSVDHDCLDEVLSINSDYIAVRGAVCHLSRTSEIDRQALINFIHAIRQRA